jgi:hypothetical protein
MRRRNADVLFTRASAAALGAWLLAAQPAAAVEPLPPELLAVAGLPSVDAAPPAWSPEPRPARHLSRIDYHSREDREHEALAARRKGKWRVFKRHIPLPAPYEDELDLYFRTPTKKAVKSRLLSAGFEVRF